MAESKSKVWDYFTKDPSGTVTCNICQSNVGQGSSKASQKNTSNLWSHLSSKHKQEYSEAQLKSAQRSTTQKLTRPQPTLLQVFEKNTKWLPNDPRTKEIDNMVMEMIATDIQPYSVVEGVGFKRLMAKAEPRYTLKTEKYFRTELMHQMYSKVVSKVKQLVTAENAGSSIAFTTDCWSGTTEALMSLTAHFIDKDWKRVQIVLNVKAMTGSHTGEYIGQMFMLMLQEWGIEAERVLLVLRDSGANMVKGMRLVEIPDLSCCAHILQLVIRDGLSSQRVVGDIIAKLKRCATHFHHSVVAQQRLAVIQEQVGVPKHTIIQAVSTRWNSELHMLQRMLEQKRALTVYATDYGHFTVPSAEEWDIVSKLVDTLTPMEQISLEMSSADASASCILPSVAILKRVLESQGPTSRGIQTLRQTMLESMDRRFSKMEGTKEVVLACILDPRYKDRPMLGETVNKAKMWLKEESEKVAQATTTAPATTGSTTAPATTTEEGEPKRPRVEEAQSSNLVDSLYDTMLQSESHPEVPEDMDEELNRYLREPVIDRRNGNPLEWWSQNSGRFKKLSLQARRYLCSPPSSVPSERVFSTVGNIYDDKRMSLSGENAEKLCFLHYNLRLLNWQY